MNKIACKNFRNFLLRELCIKNLQKFINVSFIGKNNPDFFQNFPMISKAKKRKKQKWLNPPLLIQNGE